MKKSEKITLKDLLASLDKWAPFSFQEDYDNAGLVLGNADQPVKRVLVCFDLTLAVVEEAVEKKADVIISHHPPIFRGVKRIDSRGPMGRMLALSLANDIAWVAMHTNLDNTFSGVNSYLREKLGLQEARPLVPLAGHEGEKAGAGVVGKLAKPMTEKEFLDKIKRLTGADLVRHSGFKGKKIKTVALCGGAGAGFIADARKAKADVYVTGDLKYHDFTDAPQGLLLADIGHFESEHFVKGLIYNHIKKNFPTFAVLISDKSVNPVLYY